MKACRVKGNESYPKGCRGWSKECGGVKCLSCSFYKDNSIDLTPRYEKPIPHVSKPLYGTWSRQFVRPPLDECE